MSDGSNLFGHVLYHNLGEKPLVVTRGEGVYLFDKTGKRYFDAIGGVGVVNIGHCVPEIVEAIARQNRTLAFSYGGMLDNEPQQQLAAKLQEWAPAAMGHTKTLFSSGGAEANEGALKLAYQYHWERGKTTKHKIIGRWQSYHGNSIGALSMSGRTQWRRMHSAYLLDFPHFPPPQCFRCPWGRSYPGCDLPCAHELGRVITQIGPENVAAFIAEPVIGTSLSAVVPPPEYYPIIRDICDKYDVLLIVDEVMSGVGRTGVKWGIDLWGVTPDIITASKGLSSGYSPLGAVIINEKIWRVIAEGTGTVMHSCTFGGNPASCAAGIAVLEYIQQHDLIARAGQMGTKLINQLNQALSHLSCVAQVRGKGLFVGIELVSDRDTKKPFPPEWRVGEKVVTEALNSGLIILGGVAGLLDGEAGDHFEILPPYVVEDNHLDFIITTLQHCLSKVMAKLPS